jgi:hypothetical protein
VSRICTVIGCSDRHSAKGKCRYHYSQKYRVSDRVRLRKGEPPNICAVAFCDRQVRVKAMCKWHYARKWKGLDLERPLVVRAANKNAKCAQPQCEKSAKTKLLCQTHYTRFLRGTPMDKPLPHQNKGFECKARSCAKPARSRGWCGTHAFRLKKGQDIEARVKARSWAGIKCKIDFCDVQAKSLGLCKPHYAAFSRYGQPGLDALQKYSTDGCAMCGRPEVDAGKPAVDHDHSCCSGRQVCGRCVRGALCMKCNLSLGWLEDLGLMKKAASYLRNTSSVVLQRREA